MCIDDAHASTQMNGTAVMVVRSLLTVQYNVECSSRKAKGGH